jgi:hypothetical protein
MNPVGGRGFGMGFGGGGFGRGRGFGGGFGFRNRFYATGMTGWQRAQPMMPAMTRTQEIDALKNQAEYLKESLEGVNKQLQEHEAEKKA